MKKAGVFRVALVLACCLIAAATWHCSRPPGVDRAGAARMGEYPSVDPGLLAALEWRSIGPFRGGRSPAVVGDPDDPAVFYMGTAHGGVWKTTDAGAYWRNVSDGFFKVAPVGAIDVSRSNHDVVYVGTNGKMSEISAAMGLTSLESMDAFMDANRRNFKAYRDGLAGVPGLQLISGEAGDRSNLQYVIGDIDQSAFGMTRDALQQTLWSENVLARRYFFPGCHRMEPYRSLVPPDRWHLPVTERLAARVLALPTGAAMSVEEIERVCDLVGFASAHADEIRTAISGAPAPSVTR